MALLYGCTRVAQVANSPIRTLLIFIHRPILITQCCVLFFELIRDRTLSPILLCFCSCLDHAFIFVANSRSLSSNFHSKTVIGEAAANVIAQPIHNNFVLGWLRSLRRVGDSSGQCTSLPSFTLLIEYVF